MTYLNLSGNFSVRCVPSSSTLVLRPSIHVSRQGRKKFSLDESASEPDILLFILSSQVLPKVNRKLQVWRILNFDFCGQHVAPDFAPLSTIIRVHALHTQTLVRTLSSRFCHTRWFRQLNVGEVLPSRMESSWSTGVFLVRVDLRYVNFFTFLRVVSSIVKWQVSLDCGIVFLRLLARPNLLHDLKKWFNSFWSWSSDEAQRAAWSA